MRIAVMIPSRGDRPEFISHCLEMVYKQTLQPATIKILNWPPKSYKYDITERYRIGYESLSADHDLIACIEDDDWYSPEYLEIMSNEWTRQSRPDLFGIKYTLYYHLRLRAYFYMKHERRASTMSTLIKGGLKNIEWPLDHDPFPDVHLWLKNKGLSKKLFTPSKIISIGIKHGVGKCVRNSHHTHRMHRFDQKDPDMEFLMNTVDKNSFEFYKNLSKTWL